MPKQISGPALVNYDKNASKDKPAIRLLIVLAVPALGLISFYATLAINSIRWNPGWRYGNEGKKRIESKVMIYPKISQNSKTISAGREVFYRHGCGTCHGMEGQGGVKNSNALNGEVVPSLNREGADLSLIVSGSSNIEKLKKNGQEPPLKMPSFGDKLSDQEMTDLTEYLISLIPSEASGEHK